MNDKKEHSTKPTPVNVGVQRPVMLSQRSEKIKYCKNCGNEFIPKRCTQVYCSGTCYRIVWLPKTKDNKSDLQRYHHLLKEELKLKY